MKKKNLYPGIEEAENQRGKGADPEKEPDFIGGKPNYDAFPGWDPADVLAWLNID